MRPPFKIWGLASSLATSGGVSPPAYAISGGDGTITDNGNGTWTVTITSGTFDTLTYDVTDAQLASGLSIRLDTNTVGTFPAETTIESLWLYPSNDVPEWTQTWHRDTDTTVATGNTYTGVAGDVGKLVTYDEVAANSAGTVTATPVEVQAAAAQVTPPIILFDGTTNYIQGPALETGADATSALMWWAGKIDALDRFMVAADNNKYSPTYELFVSATGELNINMRNGSNTLIKFYRTAAGFVTVGDDIMVLSYTEVGGAIQHAISVNGAAFTDAYSSTGGTGTIPTTTSGLVLGSRGDDHNQKHSGSMSRFAIWFDVANPSVFNSDTQSLFVYPDLTAKPYADAIAELGTPAAKLPEDAAEMNALAGYYTSKGGTFSDG